MTDQDVIGQMIAAGLDAPGRLELDGRVHRFGPKKRQWYRLREMRIAGDGPDSLPKFVVVGSFGDWAGETHKVEVDWEGISKERQAELAGKRQAEAERERAQRQEAAAMASMRAVDLWRMAGREGRSEYLVRKGVEAEGCRFLRDGSIVVPLINYSLPREQALRGLQRIFADGTKRFTKGFDKPGTALRLGLVAEGDPILVCEGYATGLTLRMATERRLAVFVALDCNNLAPVVQIVRELHPRNRILICADDDWKTKGNPGRLHAHKVAKATAGDTRYTWPYFRSRGPKDTDYNDLARIEGLNAVRRQLSHAIPQLQQLAHAA